MTLATLPRRQPSPALALQDDLRHIRDLVFVRELLRERGAPADELRECDAVIGEARSRLAASARQAATAA